MLMELTFIYIIPCLFTVLCIAFLIMFAALKSSPTAWAIVAKKLMLAKRGKGYAMVGWDDRHLTTYPMDVSPEGALEMKRKKGKSLTFFLARPTDDSANTEDNLLSEERDKAILPAYTLDGVLPVYIGHVSKAVATNPKTITALRVANRVNADSPRKFKGEATLPEPITMTNGGEKVRVDKILFDVLLSFDPIDIKKNFSINWQQSRIGAMKKRYETIGAEKEKASNKDFFKLMILGAIVACFMIGGVVVASKLLGG